MNISIELPATSSGLDSLKNHRLPTLIVDLDGTLVLSDTLQESFFMLLQKRPLVALLAPIWLLHGRAHLKEQIAARTALDPKSLPWNFELLSYLETQRAQGRRMVLATAATAKIANDVSKHLGLFDSVLSSDHDCNLKGENKLKAIVAQEGPEFVYAGDSSADIPIWEAASAAVLVHVNKRVANHVAQRTAIELDIQRPKAGLRTWLRLLRVHQWLKNILFFVPLLTAFPSEDLLGALFKLALAMLTFSVAASATYVFNDLGDLASDRAHPRKRNRPLASGAISLLSAAVVALALLIGAFTAAFLQSTSFGLVLAGYWIITTAYSRYLKGHVLIDVFALAVLYTIRIIAGAIVLGVAMSSWLLAFSMFIFLSLALVKRCAELDALRLSGKTAASGRDYRIGDQSILESLGTSSAMAAIVVFGIFINSSAVATHYASPNILWLVALGLIYWLARLWIKTSRGEMHDDPLVYAVRDPGSRWIVLGVIICVVAARFLHVGATW